jgi:hypothetical protein
MSYYTGPMSYSQMPVRWSRDEKTAPVPGWGMWLDDVKKKPQIIGANGFGQDTDPSAPSTPAPVTTAATTMGSSMGLVAGGVIAGVIVGYLLGKGH